jgi:signal transduction histidine kinase
MEARARLLGGKLSVTSEIDKGTTVAVTVPIEPVGSHGT